MSNRRFNQNQIPFPPDKRQGPSRPPLSQEPRLRLNCEIDVTERNGLHHPLMEDLDLHLDLEYLENENAYSDSDSDESYSDNYDQGEGWESADGSDDELQMLAQSKDVTMLPKRKPVAQPSSQTVTRQPQTVTRQPQTNGATAGPGPAQSGALVPFDDGIDVDSEEEKEIMKEIKFEIQKQIRVEMKSELDVYKSKIELLDKGHIPGDGDNNQTNRLDDNLENLEPELRDAFIKMRKLDRILSKKMKREKEVKRDRILLERRIKEELESLKPENKGQNREEKNNTDKYLALVLPPSHNEGVDLSETPAPDVFTTQLKEQDYPGLHNNNKETSENRSKSKCRSSQDGSTEDLESQQDTNSEYGSEMSSELNHGKKGRRKKNKDFIKRNKELAKDAASEIAMTEEEKLRVEGLLKDLDQLPEILEDEQDDENPFQIVLKPGEGFCPEPDERQSLERIDSRLKQLMPHEEFESISGISSRTSNVPKLPKLFTPVGIRSAADIEHYGERVLLENKEQREMKARLQRIEDELSKLHNPDEIEIETPTLQDDQLNDLLDQCARSLSRSSYMGGDSRVSYNWPDSRDSARSEDPSSRASQSEDGYTSVTDTESVLDPSADNTPRSPKSARDALMENPPKLPPDVLQKLLSEASCPMYGRLSTLMEEEENEVSDAETPVQQITAETWQLISQENTDLVKEEENEDNNYSNRQENGNISTRNSLRSSQQLSLTEREINSRNDSRVPLLPEINRSGSLVSQDLWNNKLSRPASNQSGRSSVLTIRNSLSDSYVNVQDGLEIMSIDGDMSSAASTPVPKPPEGEKRSNSGHNKSRVITPANRTSS